MDTIIFVLAMVYLIKTSDRFYQSYLPLIDLTISENKAKSYINIIM